MSNCIVNKNTLKFNCQLKNKTVPPRSFKRILSAVNDNPATRAATRVAANTRGFLARKRGFLARKLRRGTAAAPSSGGRNMNKTRKKNNLKKRSAKKRSAKKRSVKKR